jgi:hypothetical protein
VDSLSTARCHRKRCSIFSSLSLSPWFWSFRFHMYCSSTSASMLSI